MMPPVVNLLSILEGLKMLFDLWVIDTESGEISRVYRGLNRKAAVIVFDRWSRRYAKDRCTVIPVIWPNKLPMKITFSPSCIAV